MPENSGWGWSLEDCQGGDGQERIDQTGGGVCAWVLGWMAVACEIGSPRWSVCSLPQHILTLLPLPRSVSSRIRFLISARGDSIGPFLGDLAWWDYRNHL